jgi:hypothetical protein
MLNIKNGWLLKNGNAYPCTEVRTSGMWGNGTLIYVTPDGYCGIMLDGETRIDEYPGEHIGIADVASEALAVLAA